MDELLKSARKAFSKIGWIFFVFSLAVTIMQAAALVPFITSNTDDINMITVVSTFMLYLVGSLVLGFCSDKIPAVSIPKKKMSFGQFVKAFFMCYAAMIGANLIGIIFTSILGILLGGEIVNPLLELIPEMNLPVMFIVTVIGAPIFEELFFRKFIIDRLLPYGEFTALMISGFMFGLFHGNLSQFPYAFVLGAFFGYIYIRTGRIIYPMLLHAIVNFLGSIVSSFIIKTVDLNLITSILDSGIQGFDNVVLTQIFNNLEGILIYFIYELVILFFIIIGIILWISNVKKFKTYSTELQLPKGKKFLISIVNKGMIAYTILWIITIIIESIPA